VLAGCALILILSSQGALAALPESWLCANWVDVDKYHADGRWDRNWYHDENGNFQFDWGEPWTHHDVEAGEGWFERWDNSCWIASAASMVAALEGRPADEVYWEMLGYAAFDPRFCWMNGGYTHWALEEYVEQNHLKGKYAVLWYDSFTEPLPGSSPWPDDPYSFARNRLIHDGTLGVGIPGHAITFWGWEPMGHMDWTSCFFADNQQTECALNDYYYMTGFYPDRWTILYSCNDLGNATVDYFAELRAIPLPPGLLLMASGLLWLMGSRRLRSS